MPSVNKTFTYTSQVFGISVDLDGVVTIGVAWKDQNGQIDPRSRRQVQIKDGQALIGPQAVGPADAAFAQGKAIATAAQALVASLISAGKLPSP